jgi:hypothetical protein
MGKLKAESGRFVRCQIGGSTVNIYVNLTAEKSEVCLN